MKNAISQGDVPHDDACTVNSNAVFMLNNSDFVITYTVQVIAVDQTRCKPGSTNQMPRQYI